MVSKAREMKEFSDHTFHPLGLQRHQGPIIDCLRTRLSRLTMKENALQNTVYRTQCFKREIARDNWDLSQVPINANGVKVVGQ
jgi:hypothetical protein